jgi:SAM-dependent methyltransferase
MWKEAYSYILKRVVKLSGVKSGDKVLDVGSGSSKICEFFDWDIDYTGVDISPAVIEIAKKRYPNRKFCASNAADLSQFPDNEFDSVVCVEMLEHLHFHEWEEVLSEIRRVAKPSAKLVFSMPNLYYLWAYVPYSFWPLKRRLKLSHLVEGMRNGETYEDYHTSEGVQAPFHRRISPTLLGSKLGHFFKVKSIESTYWYNNRPIHGIFEKLQMLLLKTGFNSRGSFGSQLIAQCSNDKEE